MGGQGGEVQRVQVVQVVKVVILDDSIQKMYGLHGLNHQIIEKS